jgi:shikimate dehydrogenase
MSNADRYAVIGFPVSQSRSPFIHERFGRQTGQAIAYDRIEAAPETFEATVRAFFAGGGKGLNVTVPFKPAAAALADELSPRAARAKAVNTLALRDGGRLYGDNTDGAGLVRDLLNNQRILIAGRRVLLLGAGGAARGVMAPLLGLQPHSLTVANRTVPRAQELAMAFAAEGDVRAKAYDELEGPPYDIVINATAASLTGKVPSIPAAAVGAQTFCYDMAYGADDTAFVRWAQERGCTRAVMGLGMLVEQAAEAFHVWRGVLPDTASVLAALKVELAREAAERPAP